MPVLAFDQFEEIFTLGRQTPEQTARTQLLLQQLGELIENRLPPALERELTVHPELLDQFDLLRQNIKMVFTFPRRLSGGIREPEDRDSPHHAKPDAVDADAWRPRGGGD